MNKHFSKINQALKTVFKNYIYVLISLFVAFVLFSFTILITNYSVLSSTFSLELFWSLFVGGFSSMAEISLIILFAMSVLSGIVVSMSVFLVRRQIAGSLATSSSGVLVGLLAPTCPQCAIGVLGAFGLGGFISFLPFKGLELGVLGIGILIFSLFYLSNKVVTNVCKMPNTN